MNRKTAIPAKQLSGLARMPTPVSEAVSLESLRKDILRLEAQLQKLKQKPSRSDSPDSEFQELFDSAPAGYLTIDQSGLILQANAIAASQLKTEPTSLLQHPLKSFIHPEDRQIWAKFASNDAPVLHEQCQLRMMRRDGSSFWAHWEISNNRTGSASKTHIIFHDITVAIASHQSLQDSEEFYRLIVQTAQEGIWRINTESLTDYVNPKMAEMMGYSPDEMLGRPIDHFLDDAGRALLVGHIRRRKGGIAEQFEFTYRRKDGSPLVAFVTTNPITNHRGEYIGAVAMLTDIGNRKAAEAALHESEDRFRTLFENAGDGILLMEGDRFVDCNARSLEIYGCSSRDELVNRAPYQFSPKYQLNGRKSSEYAIEKITAAVSGKPQFFEWLHTKLDGTLFPAEVTLNKVESKGRVLLQAIVRDITERKKAEVILTRTADMLERTGEVAKIGGWELELNPRRLIWSQQTCRLFEVDASFVPSLEQAIEFYAPEGQTRLSEAIQQAIDQGVPYDLELEVISARGRRFWARSLGSPILEGGRVAKVIGTFQDITDRKQAELKYLQELHFNETLVDHTSVIIVLLDRQGRMVHVNQATVDILGYSREELLCHTPWDMGIMSQEEKARAIERLQVLLKGGSNPPRETILTDKLGNDRLFSLSSVATQTTEGGIDRIIVTGADLTERARLQKELLNIAEEEQARIGHNLHDGVGQTLTGVASLVDALEFELNGEQQESASRIRELVNDAIQEVRRMSHGLSPSAVKNRGLQGALQLLADTIQINHRTACDLKIDPDLNLEDLEKETHIYRIAQEACNNAIRHGKPSSISISLRKSGRKECVLKIENDGANLNRKSTQGIGLQIMDYRANLIGGALAIESKKHGGVCVICRFPCPSCSTTTP